jgi:ERCC4-related helicase
MSQSKMMAAKELIQEKRYKEARVILQTVSHPTATKWLDKLDQIAPEKRISQSKPKTNQGYEDLDKQIFRNNTTSNFRDTGSNVLYCIRQDFI